MADMYEMKKISEISGVNGNLGVWQIPTQQEAVPGEMLKDIILCGVGGGFVGGVFGVVTGTVVNAAADVFIDLSIETGKEVLYITGSGGAVVTASAAQWRNGGDPEIDARKKYFARGFRNTLASQGFNSVMLYNLGFNSVTIPLSLLSTGVGIIEAPLQAYNHEVETRREKFQGIVREVILHSNDILESSYANYDKVRDQNPSFDMGDKTQYQNYHDLKKIVYTAFPDLSAFGFGRRRSPQALQENKRQREAFYFNSSPYRESALDNSPIPSPNFSNV